MSRSGRPPDRRDRGAPGYAPTTGGALNPEGLGLYFLKPLGQEVQCRNKGSGARDSPGWEVRDVRIDPPQRGQRLGLAETRDRVPPSISLHHARHPLHRSSAHRDRPVRAAPQ